VTLKAKGLLATGHLFRGKRAGIRGKETLSLTEGSTQERDSGDRGKRGELVARFVIHSSLEERNVVGGREKSQRRNESDVWITSNDLRNGEKYPMVTNNEKGRLVG